MSETPKCPGCGNEMNLHHLMIDDVFCYICPKCKWTSPVNKSSEVALETALHRVDSGNRVLTLAEAQKKCQEDRITWYEPFRNESRIVFPVYVAPIDPSDKLVDIYAFFSDTRKEVSLYGKTWRCWLKKPTPQEMENHPWEGATTND